MLEPDTIDVATPAVQLRVLSWGSEDAPIALCLHGFPDTACRWRKVAPFMRGYAPSSLPKDGSCHVGAPRSHATIGTAAMTAVHSRRALGNEGAADGSEVAIVDHAGHFLQLDQPDVVGGTSPSSSDRRATPSSTPDDCGQPSATTVVGASDG